MKSKLALCLTLIVTIFFSFTVAASAASIVTYAEDEENTNEISSGLSNFKNINSYEAGQFNDIETNKWYFAPIKNSYELGLMKGSSENKFNPDGNVTIAETIALASRINCIYYNGEANFEQGSPWYQTYVDYAVENNIITANQFKNYTAKATRSEFASILANALPNDELKVINNVSNIPDVAAGSTNASSIYKLYNAGILTGNDKYGTFAPNTQIKRSAVAAIVNRMADVSQRQTFTLQEKPNYIPLSALDSIMEDILNSIKSIYYAGDYATKGFKANSGTYQIAYAQNGHNENIKAKNYLKSALSKCNGYSDTDELKENLQLCINKLEDCVPDYSLTGESAYLGADDFFIKEFRNFNNICYYNEQAVEVIKELSEKYKPS